MLPPYLRYLKTDNADNLVFTFEERVVYPNRSKWLYGGNQQWNVKFIGCNTDNDQVQII